MPITVNGPDGKQHSFPEGTTGAQINEAMTKLYGGGGLDQAGLPTAGDPTAATGAVMPSMQSTPAYNTPEDRMNIGLSMILPPGAVSALQNTPGQLFRREQAKHAADNLGKLEEKQRAGLQVLAGLEAIKNIANTEAKKDPAAFHNAIGPWQSGEGYQAARKFVADSIPIVSSLAWPYEDSYNLNNRLNHAIHGLTTQFMTAGGSSGMSDERMQTFANTIGAMMHATNLEDFNRIVQDADHIIRSSFGLPQEAPKEGGDKPPSDVEAKKTLNGRNYVKIKGQWYEE